MKIRDINKQLQELSLNESYVDFKKQNEYFDEVKRIVNNYIEVSNKLLDSISEALA